MPLAPIADNATPCAWLQYTSMDLTHEIMFRVKPGTSDSGIITLANSFVTNMAQWMLTTDAFTGLRRRAAGSTISVPLAFTGSAGTLSATVEQQDVAKYVDIVGRDSEGYRSRMTFFTPQPADSINYRVDRAANNIADIFLDWAEAFNGTLGGKSGNTVVWKQYANLGYNAYWQKEVRA